MKKNKKLLPDPEPVNFKEWRAANKILKKAVKLIHEKGWQQGETEPCSQLCLATAIEQASLEKKYSFVDFNYAREAVSRILNVPRDPVANPSDPLAVPYWGRHFMEWNDTPGRTKEQVTDALYAASVLADELAASSKH